MNYYYSSIAVGSLFGAFLGWILVIWVKIFVTQVYAAIPKNSPDYPSECKSLNVTDWIIIVLLTTCSGALAYWRQWDPKFLSDIILVTALIGVSLIDRKTMLIEGRMIALAIILRLCWLLYFTPQDTVIYLSGMLIGAGLLFFVGFLYETFRRRQGLGEGDAAVLGLIGMWVGWKGLAPVLLISALSGIIIGGISLLVNREKKQELFALLQTQIPFAPYLCLAGLTVYLLQETGSRNLVPMFDLF